MTANLREGEGARGRADALAAPSCPSCDRPAAPLAGVEGRPLHLCDTCGLGFDPLACARADTLDPDFFADSGYDGWLGGGPRRHQARFRLGWLGHFAPAPARLLEIGAGGGHFLDEARAAGYAPAGVELAPALAQAARELAGVPVVAGRFEDSGPPAGAVDVVCAWRTLEYAPDPSRFLDAARYVLVPGGILAMESWNAHLREPARMLGEAASLPGDPPRLYFTPVAMRIALERAQFDVIACETIYAEALESGDSPRRRFSRPPRTHPVRGEFIRVVARRP